MGKLRQALFVAALSVVALGALALGGAGVGGTAKAAGKPPTARQTLYDFCSQTLCTDGTAPAAELVIDRLGNLYGTTAFGGNGTGVVFELMPGPTGWREKVLYAFCSQSNCADGSSPLAGLIIDSAGNLYGTTIAGGSGGGVVFQLTPNQDRSAWTETVLYAFCSQANCTDGNAPTATLAMDGSGNLYGTTQAGGSGSGGVAFQLMPNQNHSGWTETVLYNFCSQSNCADGSGPGAGLLIDGNGNLYGATSRGGSSYGVVFELTPNQARTAWTETVLYSFCGQANCSDGANPGAALIMDQSGNLYGTTYSGGSSTTGNGVAFQLTPQQHGGWTQTVLYTFCAQSGCADGARPHASLLLDPAGNLYGTTVYGGGTADGVLFQLTPNQSRSAWTETVLYSFCQQSNCTDGSGPGAAPIMDAAGVLYGTTQGGGANNGGTVYALAAGITLDVTVSGNGKVKSSPAAIDCPTRCLASFASGTSVTLSALPVLGASFTGWGGACSGNGNCTLMMNSSQKVSAMFSSYTLSVSLIGSRGGLVVSSPPGINCADSSCSANFGAGAQVSLSALPASGWSFAGWGGACSGSGSCALTMSGSESVSATFLAPPNLLVVVPDLSPIPDGPPPPSMIPSPGSP